MVSDLSLPTWPSFEDDELKAVERVLRSGKINYWTGSVCREFEDAWTKAHSGVRSITIANGSLSLDVAIRSLGLGPGDEVIVSPRSYVASAMCVILAGATPVFADVDAESGCMTPDTADLVRSARTRAVIPVHIGGWPCDMPAFARWADRHGVHLIEDCAQAHGGSIGGRKVGTFGALASWSFCQDKIISTGGEGGMLCTSDPELFKRCWSHAQHGKDFDEALSTRETTVPGDFRWLVKHQGTNLRMTELQAAIGLRQLSKLPAWGAARRRNSEIMQEALRQLTCLRVPTTPEGHAHYRCTVFVVAERGQAFRNQLLRALRQRGLAGMTGSCGEIYREHAFATRRLTPAALGRGLLDDDGRLPNARLLAETSLTFPVHHTINESVMRNYAALVSDCIRTEVG